MQRKCLNSTRSTPKAGRMKYIWACPCPNERRTSLEVRNVPNTCVDGRKMWPPLSHSQLRSRASLQWPGPGRPLGLGQSDRRLFGLFGSTKSCLKMKSLLGETIVGGIFRKSLIGVDFVSVVCAKAVVGHAKAQATISIIALFIVPILQI